MQRKHDRIKIHTMVPTTGLDTNINISHPYMPHAQFTFLDFINLFLFVYFEVQIMELIM